MSGGNVMDTRGAAADCMVLVLVLLAVIGCYPGQALAAPLYTASVRQSIPGQKEARAARQASPDGEAW